VSAKGAHRCCDDENADPKEILSAHGQALPSRLQGADELLLISDATHLTPPEIRTISMETGEAFERLLGHLL
jgi:hypothetical protein